MLDSPARRAAALLGVWTTVGLGFGLQITIVEQTLEGGRYEWWRPFLINVLCYLFWWMLTPAVLWLGRRHPFDRERWRRSLAVHAAGSLVFPVTYLLLTQVFVFHWLRPSVYRPRSLGKEYVFSVVANLHLEILTYWTIVGIQYAVRTFREMKERELRASQMETRLVEARLEALKMQLQPHFLFNTLNAISALVHEDPEAADRMISRLAELLRRTLDGAGKAEVPLREELETLDRYLEIESIRFPDRLSVERRIDEDALDALVPALLLQPLVENAIRHGIARRTVPGRVVLGARLRDGALDLTVRNDGPPLPVDGPGKEGVGLSNTRARLAQLYPGSHRFDLTSADGGVLASVSLPYRREAA